MEGTGRTEVRTDCGGPAISIMEQQKYRKNRTDADIYINPLLKGYTTASFQPEAIDTMIMRGEHAAAPDGMSLWP